MTMMQMLLMATTSLTPLPDAYLDLDFASNSYRLADAASSYDAAFLGSSPKLTYTATSNSTMVNSSGNLVWAPHNFVGYSEDFSQWSASGITLTSSTATDPLGGSTASTYSGFSSGTNSRLTEVFTAARNFKCTLAIWLKGTAGETIELELDTSGAAENEITFTGSWQLETISNDNPTTGRVRIIYRTGNTADVVSVWGAHVYRSDLGGMAPVPGAATGFEYYVPTNGAAEYLPRVGHHVYDTTTSAWVNEGLLIESEARTNLRTYSTVPDSTNAYRVNATSTSSTETAPDGSTDAVLLTATGTSYSNAWDNYNNTYGANLGAEVTYSFWIKAAAATSVTLQQGGESVTYTFATDSMTTTSGATGHVEHYGNGWVRLGCTATKTNQFHYWQVKLDGTTKTAHVWGVQLEVASTPSSYIPTDGSTVTRDAQTLTVPSSELGWNSSGISLAIEGRITASDDAEDIMTLSQWKETNIQRIDTKIRWNGAYQGNVHVLAYNGSSPYTADEGVGAHSVSDGVLSPYNIAWRHTSSTLQSASSGSAISPAGTPNNGVVDLSASDMTLGTDYMGTISHVRQWDEDIGETGIEEASS